MTYYAQRKSIKGEAVTFNNRTGSETEMLRQYFLYCAAAVQNTDQNNYDYVDFGTVERGPMKDERFRHNVEPEPEPEPNPEAE